METNYYPVMSAEMADHEIRFQTTGRVFSSPNQAEALSAVVTEVNGAFNPDDDPTTSAVAGGFPVAIVNLLERGRDAIFADSLMLDGATVNNVPADVDDKCSLEKVSITESQVVQNPMDIAKSVRGRSAEATPRITYANSIVSVIDGEAFVTTAVMAEVFGRPHRFVVRSLNNLIENTSINACSTARISYTDSRGRMQNCYQLSERDAFVLMPFIGGTRSMKGQARLVDAFMLVRKMLGEVHRQHSDPDRQRARIEGKNNRRAETDVIARFVQYAISQGSRGAKHYYLQITKVVNCALFFMDDSNKKSLRDRLTQHQLESLSMAEKIIERALQEGIAKKLPYKEIYRCAADCVIQFAALVGRSSPGLDLLMLSTK